MAISHRNIIFTIAEDGRTGSFVIGKESFPASLLDLPCVVESYKTYDDNVLIKTADIGQVSAPVSFHLRFFLAELESAKLVMQQESINAQ